MLGPKFEFEGVKGVGSVVLDLQPDQRVYALIGANGIGKTKTLEALFQVLIATNQDFAKQMVHYPIPWVFSSVKSAEGCFSASADPESLYVLKLKHEYQQVQQNNPNLDHLVVEHRLPVIFLASQRRGFIDHEENTTKPLGSTSQRRNAYFESLRSGMTGDFASLNMDTGIEAWFVMLGQSANPYQSQEDNRKVEIETVLKLLHEIDNRIDPDFLEISGDQRVSLKIEGQKRELSHLSTGFASILKILQAIVSGYGYFTNEIRLQQVKGYVLIDEIESHLHLTWQAKIIPLLKTLFPNTTFYITTHSSIVLSQLSEGEAYRLARDESGVVRTNCLTSPNKSAFVDVLKDAFGIDLNKLKRDQMSALQQEEAKRQLLSLLKQQGNMQ